MLYVLPEKKYLPTIGFSVLECDYIPYSRRARMQMGLASQVAQSHALSVENAPAEDAPMNADETQQQPQQDAGRQVRGGVLPLREKWASTGRL